MSGDGFSIRPCTPDDIPTILRHRLAMFRDMGIEDPKTHHDVAGRVTTFLQARMPTGEYLHWFALDPSGAIAAGGGLWIMPWFSQVSDPSVLRGNILNVYTERAFRRRGLARRITETAVAACRERGIRTVILHASDEGRPLYEQMGFKPSNEMRLRLDPPVAGS